MAREELSLGKSGKIIYPHLIKYFTTFCFNPAKIPRKLSA